MMVKYLLIPSRAVSAMICCVHCHHALKNNLLGLKIDAESALHLTSRDACRLMRRITKTVHRQFLKIKSLNLLPVLLRARRNAHPVRAQKRHSSVFCAATHEVPIFGTANSDGILSSGRVASARSICLCSHCGKIFCAVLRITSARDPT